MVPDLRAFFDWVLTLPAQELNSFSGAEWGGFILMVILGFRLSFPVAECPGWDDGWARAQIGFGEYLERFDRVGGERCGGGGGIDVLGAVKVVLGVVRRKWERRVRRMEARQKGKGKQVGAGVAGQEQQQQQQQQGLWADVPFDLGLGADLDIDMEPMLWDTTMQGCPMMDGSLEPYFSLWDESFPPISTGEMALGQSGVGVEGGPPLPASEYADIWDTMTAGWAQWPQTNGAGSMPG